MDIIEPETINSFVTLVALIISITAMIYTVKAYLLKSGEKIRCSYSTRSSVDCDDTYVGNITLENLKDRSVVIFGIYMRIGENYFLELENFENSPLILKPFEAYNQNFDAILFYSVNMRKIDLNTLLDDEKIKKTIMLSTSNGKYEVKANMKRWNPILDFFKNHMTAIIQPRRLSYKGKSYGSNIKYLIEFKYYDNSEDIIPIRSGDERLKIFANFQLTKESLESKKSLELFLRNQKKKGNIKFSKVEVMDFSKGVERVFTDYDSDKIEAKYYGKIKYKVFGKLYTAYDSYKLKKANGKIRN